MRIRPLISLLLVLCLWLGLNAQTQAETRAVLVGVSDYTYLDADLLGPRNDVVILAEALMARGILAANIQVLSDNTMGLDPAISTVLPTRKNILSSLDRLATQSQEGDTALFYFSGHGAQMPDQDGDEQGGYDEIFLPSDAKSWKGSIGAVENAIVDDELREKSVAILAKGAKLVAILDACFSGTGFRALGGAGKARYLDPDELGVPAGANEPKDGNNRNDLDGEFVFLYSSQPDQRSFEFPLEDRDGGKIWYGDFTRNLVQVLQSSPELSYSQLLQAAKGGMRKGATTATQTPDGEGPMLTSLVFGTGKARAPRVKITKGEMPRGLLSGLSVGAEIAVFADATSTLSLGSSTLITVTANSARLDKPTSFDLPDTAYGEVLRPGVPAAMIVAPPKPLDPFDGYDYRELVDVVTTFSEQENTGILIRETGFDAALVLSEGTLILTGRDGVVDPGGADSSPRMDISNDGKLAKLVAGWLTRIGRVYALRQAVALAQETSSGGFGFGAGLQVTLERRQGSQSGADCKSETTNPVAFSDGEKLDHCDQLWLKMKNTSGKPRDVTVLYVDRDFHISALWPVNNLSNRLGSGESKKLGFQMVNPTDANGGTHRAFEELIVLNVVAETGSGRTVLTGFAENETSRDVPDTGLEEYFMAASAGDTTSRAFSLKKPLAALKVDRFSFEILPQTGK